HVHTQGVTGLTINLTTSTAGKSSTVRGLVVNRFVNGFGMSLIGNVGSVVAGNFVGTDVSGTVAPDGSNYYRFHPAQFVAGFRAPQATMTGGVWFTGGSGNVVGTDGDGLGDAGERNLLDATNFAVAFLNASTGN